MLLSGRYSWVGRLTMTEKYIFPIRVRCRNCNESFDENTVEILGIEEDEFGRDRICFICPICKKEQYSFRYG